MRIMRTPTGLVADAPFDDAALISPSTLLRLPVEWTEEGFDLIAPNGDVISYVLESYDESDDRFVCSRKQGLS